MASRASKRKREGFNPNKSDSDDEDYDERAQRAVKQKPSRSSKKRAPKRRRREDRDEESEESEMGETEGISDDESFDDDPVVEEPVELDSRTGRPTRSSRKKPIKYDEGSGSDLPEDAPEDARDPPRREKKQIIRLKVTTPQQQSATSTRTTRAGSMPQSRRGASGEPSSAGTRRSTRLHHDERDTMVALTGSGKHVEIVRPATRSPEGVPRRSTRGAKGIKAPATSAIFEEEEETGSLHHAHDRPAEPPSSPQRPHPSEAGTHKGILSVEDSDPDRAQEAPLSDAQKYSGDEFHFASEHDAEEEEEEDDDTAAAAAAAADARGSEVEADDEEEEDGDPGPRSSSRRASRAARRQRKPGAAQQSSDHEFHPEEAGDEDMSSSGASDDSPRRHSQRQDDAGDESSGRRSGRAKKAGSRATSSRRRIAASEEPGSEGAELQEELENLRADRPRRTRRSEIVYVSAPKLRDRKKNVDYRILRPDLTAPEEQELEPQQAPTPSRRGRGGGGGTWHRSLFSTYGPFGGAGGPTPVFGAPGGLGATGGVASDSSEDEGMQRLPHLGGAVGMTPTSAAAPGLLPVAQVHGADAVQGPSGTPANLGRIKDRKALADADPLGVDQNVSFESVGGLKDHINQLKEMVTLPLLYPEIFQRFHVTPPRGVLFHGPPGTGKTLLARALAASVSSHGRKIAFYMRKGADALSKWVGEAERQLRLLFEEARANQPSIIFFDEIDGKASRVGFRT